LCNKMFFLWDGNHLWTMWLSYIKKFIIMSWHGVIMWGLSFLMVGENLLYCMCVYNFFWFLFCIKNFLIHMKVIFWFASKRTLASYGTHFQRYMHGFSNFNIFFKIQLFLFPWTYKDKWCKVNIFTKFEPL